MLLANGAMPRLFDIPDSWWTAASYVVGVLGLGLAGLLAWGAIYTAARARLDSSAKVFGRGFLGVSAVLVLLIAGLFLVIPFVDARPGRLWAAWLLGAVVTLGLVAEFIVAGLLYRRVRRYGGTVVSTLLSIASFVFAGLIGLVGLLVGLLALVPDPKG
jgi:hypothetical protein